jgi:carbamoyl-phosphate synthase large subunit
LDHYLTIEAEADATCDGENVYHGMEHIELVGFTPGDSNALLPPFTLGDLVMQQIKDHTKEDCISKNTLV